MNCSNNENNEKTADTKDDFFDKSLAAHHAAAAQAQREAYDDARIFMTVYKATFNELRERGKLNFWKFEIVDYQDCNPQDYIPESINPQLTELRQLIASHTAYLGLPGEF